MNRRTGAAFVAVIIGAATIGSMAMGDKAAEKTNPDAPATDPYWTPERLRAAKPIELPHPDEPAPEVPRPSGDAGPSVSGAGHAGSGGVAPEDRDLLDPEGGTPDDR